MLPCTSQPMRRSCPAGWVSAVRGTVRSPRARLMMIPTGRNRMVISFSSHWPADGPPASMVGCWVTMSISGSPTPKLRRGPQPYQLPHCHRACAVARRLQRQVRPGSPTPSGSGFAHRVPRCVSVTKGKANTASLDTAYACPLALSNPADRCIRYPDAALRGDILLDSPHNPLPVFYLPLGGLIGEHCEERRVDVLQILR